MKYLLSAALFLLTAFPVRAELSVSVSKTALTEGESFQLRLRQDEGDIKADISPVYKDFSLIGQQSSSQTTIINGKMSRKNELTLTLVPKTTGKVVLPSLSAGREKTKPITITVSEAGSSADGGRGAADGPTVFVRAEIGGVKPYIAQQVPYTVKVYVPENVNLLEGAFLPPSADGVVVEQWGSGRRYTEKLDGKPYAVVEVSFLLFPQKTGKIALTPAGFRGVVSDPFARGSADRTHFSFGGFAMFGDERNILLRAKPVTLDVQPAASDGDWLPATSVSVAEEVAPSSGEVAVGDTITRTVTVTAAGAKESQIPDPVFPETDGFKQYPGQSEAGASVNDKGIVGVKTRQIVFMPTRAGTLTLPPLEYKWFDVGTGKPRKAVLPSRKVAVVQGEGTPAPQTAAASGPVPNGEAAAAPAGDSPAGTEKREEKAPSGGLPAPVQFAAGALCGVLFGALCLFLCGGRSGKGKAADRRDSDVSVRAAERALKEACAANDAVNAGKAFLTLMSAVYPDDPPSTLSVAADRIGDAALSAELAALNGAVWSGKGGYERGGALWAAYKAAGAKIRKTVRRETGVLPPLYPD